MAFDLRGAFYGLGPQGRVLELAPSAAAGFVERMASRFFSP
jgi:hypothetical protein